VFENFDNKNVLKIFVNVKKRKNVTKVKKTLKRFYIYDWHA